MKEFSAHVIPEAGYDMMPELVGDGILVAGDAAAMCLAAGIWLEGVNFAIGSGAAAGRAASAAIRRGDTTREGSPGTGTRLESSFVLADHRKLREAPHLVMGDLAQRQLPAIACGVAESVFTVTNPDPKPGLVKIIRTHLRHSGLRFSTVARETWRAFRAYG
ncbi:MAG: hypothetical protein M5U19_05975 [Microthrixaceae bacterium]|nr:hypothetical protein [Microthrixaceae bacterium]